MLIITIIIASAAIAAISYSAMPDPMATHWGINGEPNGYSDKFFGTFLMPGIIFLITALLIFIPKIDPLKENIKKFYSYYENFVIVIIGFMLLTQIFMLLWNTGIKINPSIAIPLGIGVLFYYAGIMMQKAKRNWTIGIRTTWTLSSEKVWDKTHRLGGRMFRAAGIISLIGAFIPAYSFFFIIVPVLLSSACLIVYSYLEYRKEMRKSKNRKKRK
jgi:uncharacterized membrane protein